MMATGWMGLLMFDVLGKGASDMVEDVRKLNRRVVS